MLSFELSVVDIVLVMAIIILLLLFMTGGNTKNTKEPELSCKNWKDEILRRVTKGKEESLRRTKKRETLEEPRKNVVTPETSEKKESSIAPSPEGSPECSHHFGYLKTLPLGSIVPEECHTCSRAMQCFLIDEQNTARAHNIIS